MKRQVAVIIGAGPAGLTAAYELASRTIITPIVVEKQNFIGGLATTLDYKGNKIDLGGHRFFSKSDRVLKWWFSFFPVSSKQPVNISYHGNDYLVSRDKRKKNKYKDEVMLIRSRLSRIYYQGKFFSYPIKLNINTIWQIGYYNSALFFASYLKASLFPRKPEVSLEDFFINRFGERLYKTFFQAYTEKVWGQKCSTIPALWGSQRVKGITLLKTILESVRPKRFFLDKKQETSFIENFLYPKYGPGQLWSAVAREIGLKGGQIHKNSEALEITRTSTGRFIVKYKDHKGLIQRLNASYVFSTMPIKELLRIYRPKAPTQIARISEKLEYRDFVVIGLLLKKLSSPIKDTWLYIHDPNVKVGRIQIFNNWSPDLVKEKGTIWIGMEYFCNSSDSFWNQADKKIIDLAINELATLKLADLHDLLDGTVVHVPKAYPAYTGGYKKFNLVRKYLDSVENLFLIGRNGMHKYNNQDHSMLTAMTAVDNIIAGRLDKSNIWDINTEDDYHEEK